MKDYYYHDKPVNEESEDMLGYNKFVEQVFSYIRFFMEGKDSNVIGLAGDWGDGKTTVINFLKNKINKEYLNFNVKNFTINFKYVMSVSINVLIIFLFYAVLTSLVILSVERYSKYPIIIFSWILFVLVIFVFQRIERLPKSISKIIKTAFLKKDYIVMDFKSWSCKDENQVLEQFFKNLSEQIDIGFIADNNMQKYVKAILKYNKINLDIFSAQPSLKELYDNIEKSLNESNKKIIVFIDDIDRMTGQEVLSILKLVKVVADFPNILYVLAYNKNCLVSELSTIIKYNPQVYLEKIITNEFRLPNIKSKTLKQYLFENVDKYVGVENDNYDRNGIINSFEIILQPYICNLRKVYRVLNTFAFHYTKFKEAGILINIADLFYLTVIKIFNLSLYDKIWQSKEDIFSYRYVSEEEKKKYGEKYIIGSIECASISEIDQKLINIIFKERNSKFDVKRLNNQNHFELYFSFDLPKSIIIQTITWLKNYPASLGVPLDYEYDATFISDMWDLMYSKLYYEHRNLNFVFGLFELMIRNFDLARHLYIDTHKSYLNNRVGYINEYDEKRIADFINHNKERCNINLLEWLLFDGLFSDGTSSLTQQRVLSKEVEKIKQDILNTLTVKFEKCDLMEITSVHTLERFIVTYNLKDMVKIKLLKYLDEEDENITKILRHFTSVGTSSTIGAFYNLYIIDQIVELGIAKEYSQRLLEIKNNTNIMYDLQYINYYAGNREFADDVKIHIIDKSISLLQIALKEKQNI